jgi:DNA-binding transcriptional ArsR family regulator
MYQIDYTKGICEDIVVSLLICCDILKKRLPNLTYPKTVEKIHKHIKRKMEPLNEAFPLLVNDDVRFSLLTSIVQSVCYYGSGLDFPTIESFIDQTVRVPANVLMARCIFNFDCNKNEYTTYLELVKNNSDISKYINKMDISDKNKALLLSAMLDMDYYANLIVQMVEKARDVVLKIHEEHADYIRTSFKVFENQKNVLEQLKTAGYPVDFDEIIVIPVLLNPGVNGFLTPNGKLNLKLGFEFAQFLEKIKLLPLDVDIDGIGKIFGDKTRCDIINLLLKEEHYLSELSVILKTPANTLCYHMQLLYDAGVVVGRNQGKKFYYKLNNAYFEGVKQLAQEFIDKIGG